MIHLTFILVLIIYSLEKHALKSLIKGASYWLGELTNTHTNQAKVYKTIPEL